MLLVFLEAVMLMWCESAGMTVISVGVAKSCHFRNPVPAIPAKQTQLACGLMRGPRAEMLCYLIIESHVLSKAPSRTFKAIYNNPTHHLACTKQSQVCQTFTSKEAAETVNFLWRYFFFFLPDLPLWARTASDSLLLFLTLAAFPLFSRLPSFPLLLLSCRACCGYAPAWLPSQLQTLRLHAGVGGLHHCLWGESPQILIERERRLVCGKQTEAIDVVGVCEEEEKKRAIEGNGNVAWESEEEVRREQRWGRFFFCFTWRCGRTEMKDEE